MPGEGIDEHVQCDSKNPPLTFFPNGWEFLTYFYTPIIRYYLR